MLFKRDINRKLEKYLLRKDAEEIYLVFFRKKDVDYKKEVIKSIIAF
jgi:hypothetical protein